MTTGYAIPATNAPTSQEYEATYRARLEANQEKDAAIADGYATLGYVFINGSWQQRYAEQSANLPAGLVEQARAALAAETRARDALRTAVQQAQAWVDRNRPDDGKAPDDLKKAWTEANTALRDAKQATEPAMLALGAALKEIATARATINGISARKRAADDWYQTQLAKIETDRLTAQAVLQRLGLS